MSTSSVRSAHTVGLHRRKSQVFVEIPPSPLFNKPRFQPPKVDNSSNQHKDHKENAVPLSTKALLNNIPADAKGSGKRKLQDGEDVETNANLKKVKVQHADGDNLVPCHQCRGKKKSSVVLQCTSNLTRTGKRCAISYCEACLKTRYGENLQDISQRKLPQSREGHDPNTDYHFTCPRCSDFCNCAPCRKKKGLAPVGRFLWTKEGDSVREILEKNPQASGSLAKNMVKPVPKLSNSADAERPSDGGKQTKDLVKLKVNHKVKAVPEPVWRPAPQYVTRREIEDRIYLREFILRFNPILDISLRNVEELDDFSTLHDQSTKAILLALLDLIAVEDDGQRKRIQDTVKKIRSLGLNWSKIVLVLYDIRDSVPEGHTFRSLPNVEQAEAEATYNTRGANMHGIHADHLLPILLYLIEIASVGASVRQELEEGLKQGKEVRSAYFKAQREEAERWAVERAALTEEKEEIKKKGLGMDAFKAKYHEAEGRHKAIVVDIQNSYKPDMDMCNPRFTSLGSDMEGRTYYALSASGPQRHKKERPPSEGERARKWGWFISVWGKPGTIVQKPEDDMDENEETDSQERWWSFADVQDMRKLSKWLAYRAEVEMPCKQAKSTKSQSIDETPLATGTTMTSTPLTSRPPSPPRNTVQSIINPNSPSAAISGSDSDEAMDVEVGLETDLTQPATQAGVKALAKAVLEFADFVDWRTKNDERSAKQTRRDS